MTYIIKDDDLAAYLASSCGAYSLDKKMPFKRVMSFSKRQAELLIEAMLSGDGHKHKKGHSVYYTSSKRLADDLYALMIKVGIPGQIYGPYKGRGKNPMYQVFISHSRSGNPTIAMNKSKRRMNGYSGWEKHMMDGRVVCFTVPNGVLITRNNGKVAIHGNSKNMMHCFRLLWSGRDILETGEPTVRFEGEEAEKLKDIRAGKYTYAELIQWVEQEMEDLKRVRDESDLPEKVNMKAIDGLYKELTGSLTALSEDDEFYKRDLEIYVR